MTLKDFRFENLSRLTQILIFVGLGLVLVASFYFLYIRGLLQERDALKRENAELWKTVEQGRAIASQLERFKNELAQLEERLNVLRSILPSEKETPEVLRSVQRMASSSSLKITRFTPQPVTPRAFYSDWPIQIEVQGSYDGLGLFFEKVSQATRIINVGNIGVKGIEGSTDASRTLSAVCTATTFVFREELVATSGK